MAQSGVTTVADLASELRSVQKRLVAALQAETFCEDLEPPARAWGWDAAQLVHYFESGGKEEASSTAPSRALATADSVRPARPAMLLLGDSLTDLGMQVGTSRETGGFETHGPGWCTLLARDYQNNRSMDLINRGFSGYNTAWVRSELPSILSTLPATLLVAVVLLGSNDCVAKGQIQHVPLMEYEANLRAIVQQLRDALSSTISAKFSTRVRPTIFLVTPPPAEEARWAETLRSEFGVRQGDGRSAESIAPYAEAARRVARCEGCELVDLNRQLSSGAAGCLGPLGGLSDGLHFDQLVPAAPSPVCNPFCCLLIHPPPSQSVLIYYRLTVLILVLVIRATTLSTRR